MLLHDPLHLGQLVAGEHHEPRGLARTRSYSGTVSASSMLQPKRAHSQRKPTGESGSPGHWPRTMPSLTSRNTSSLEASRPLVVVPHQSCRAAYSASITRA